MNNILFSWNKAKVEDTFKINKNEYVLNKCNPWKYKIQVLTVKLLNLKTKKHEIIIPTSLEFSWQLLLSLWLCSKSLSLNQRWESFFNNIKAGVWSAIFNGVGKNRSSFSIIPLESDLHSFLLSDNTSNCLGRDQQFCPQPCCCNFGQVL